MGHLLERFWSFEDMLKILKILQNVDTCTCRVLECASVADRERASEDWRLGLNRGSTSLSAIQTCLDVSSRHLGEEGEVHQAEQKHLLWLEEEIDEPRAISTNTSRIL